MKRKTISLALIIFLFLLVSDCATLYHDQSMNPCTENSKLYNKEDCENWKKNFPREYNAYIKRKKINQ